MFTRVVQSALNEQMNVELAAAHEYLAMSAWCEKRQLRGMAKWLRAQSDEEQGHAMKLYDFLIARNSNISLRDIPAPQVDYESPLELFNTAMEHEVEVSRQIDALYELAFKEKAFAALVELQWFISEQVEEEHTFREIVAKLQAVRDDSAALLDVDRELAQRE